MKKMISIFLAVAILISSICMLSSCGEKHECDFCGEEKKCVTKTFLGEEIYVCSDCIGEINGFFGE